MSLTKVTYSLIDAPVLNLRDYGAVGNGVANDTAAWTSFIADCSAKGYKGVVPAGTYLVDPFTFGSSNTGLVLEGESFNPSSPPPSSAGFFGVPVATLKARSASSGFVSISGAYYLQISNIAFDGGGFSDSVWLFPGVATVTEIDIRNCEFYGCTPTTGYIHHYATGSQIQVDNSSFTHCRLSTGHNQSGTNKAAAVIRNANTNALLISYQSCFFSQGFYLAKFGAGSCNFYDCSFFSATTAMIAVDSITQPFTVINAYNEGTPNVPFLTQDGTAGVKTGAPIIIINAIINSTNAGMNLNCQQPVLVYGGTFGGNINVTPMATYGYATNIFDSVNLNSGYAITGTGAITRSITRNYAVNLVPQASVDYGALPVAKYTDSTNAGAILSATNETWLVVSNSAPQNITGLTGGLVGQQIILYFADANSTLINSTTFKLTGSTNVTPTANSVITFIGSGAAPGLAPVYWAEVSRSIK
jgi:hypothetical protein